MTGWALDLGTTNSAVARWDEFQGQPRLVELPAVCRGGVDHTGEAGEAPASDDPFEAPRLVPTAVHFVETPGLLDRLGGWPPLQRHFFLGRRAFIGRAALARNEGVMRPSFVPAFKVGLASDPLRPLARVGPEPVTARQAAHGFLRELLREVKSATGRRPRELVVTSPVMAFETYRAEIQALLAQLGVGRVRFLDEPVAAALGYGLSAREERTVLVVDVGGGTMHVVLLRMSPRAAGGEATVLGKRGRQLGGNTVDSWVLEDVCRQLGYDLSRAAEDEVARLWRRLMLAEARRVKEAVFFADDAAFLMTPPALPLGPPRPGSEAVTVSRAGLRALLEQNGFYRGLTTSLEEVLEQGKLKTSDVDDVLLVGGSTLLPGFYPLIEERFERHRLRAWQPFEAVAHGAATFAAGHMAATDFIVHDYAFVTHDAVTGAPQYTVVVPRGTRFPTAPDLWKREVVPTCPLGEPETIFKLLICEVARADGGGRRFVWDAAGDLHKVGGASGEAQVVVPLNGERPTLGILDPPHAPRDRRPRLEIAFGVNADRWLIATVRDLLAGRHLLREEPVVRLV